MDEYPVSHHAVAAMVATYRDLLERSADGVRCYDPAGARSPAVLTRCTLSSGFRSISL